MKYNKIKSTKKLRLSIDDFSRGVNSDNEAFDKGYIKESENFWFKDGELKTRPSLKCVSEELFPIMNSNVVKLTITDTVYYKDGIKYNIAYYSTGNAVSHEYLHVYLIADRNNIIPLGSITFYRLDSSTFYYPNTLNFFVGEKTHGYGIYLFLTKVIPGSRACYAYEATADGWTALTGNDFYIPTIYVNGRGNYADHAVELFPNLNLGEPSVPEQLNLLTPKFKAYYTSDGFSWLFFLPEKNLDNTGDISCRVYMDSEEYLDFSIPPGGSDTVMYLGSPITAYCDRSSGKLYFMSNGIAKPIPQIPLYTRNNIIVTAAKTQENGFDKVVSCTGAVIFNSRAYLYGSAYAENEIYSCRLSNPLYFPKVSKAKVGASNQKIVAVGYQNDKVIVFKQNEIYKLNVSKGSTMTVLGNAFTPTKDYIISDTITSESISTKVGCFSDKTLSSCAGQLVWLGGDKKVYTLEATTYGSEKNIFELSEKVGAELQKEITANSSPFAFAHNGHYCLFVNNKAFVCDCHITNMGYASRYGAYNKYGVSWYCWKFPHEIITGAGNCNEIIICTDEILNYHPKIAFFDDSDIDVFTTRVAVGESKTVEKPISVKLRSKDYTFENANYFIPKKLLLKLKRNRSADVEFITDKEQFKKHIHSVEGDVCIETSIGQRPAESVGFSLSGEGTYSLKRAIIECEAVE